MTSVNGWALYAHPLLTGQLEKLTDAAERERHIPGPNTKLLAALNHLIFEAIPQDPSRPEYRQGATLGSNHKHWFRAKFGNGRYRLFYRYDSQAKVIVYAWVNDASTLRTYGSRTDAYAGFGKMLKQGNPPDDWKALLEAAGQHSTDL